LAKPRRDIEDYLVYVEADRCDGCEECAILCPVGVFEVSHKASVVYPQNCMGCRTCEAVCKSDAVIITEI
jgi:NAD-dependent dihydropyrimidine dehydrogenase PreA subunit